MTRGVSTPVDLSPPRLGRVESLDGLRGIASVIVVIYHALLTTTIGNAFLQELGGKDGAAWAAKLLADTPLRFLVMGPEAVVVFFVLSGVVLVLPMLHGKGLDLWSYYPRRFARLWLPAAASLIFAAVLIVVVKQNPANGASDWIRRYSFSELSPTELLKSSMFVTNFPGLNNPMWSLKWEMLFSLALPLAFVVVVLIKRAYVTALLFLCLASGVGAALAIPSLRYAPMFLAGGVAAKLISDSVRPIRLPSWLLVAAGAALLYVPDFVRALTGVPSNSILQSFVVAGAVLIVVGLSRPSAIGVLFASRPMQFLGRISFSLYLVHVPVLIAVAHLVPDAPNKVLMLSVPLAFIAGWLFTKFVEEPSARLARKIGALGQRAQAQFTQASVTS